MANESLLLNFVVPTTIRDVVPSADLSWLKDVVALVEPLNSDVEPGFYECTNKAQIELLTSAKCFELLDSGMKKILLLVAPSLDIAKSFLDNDKEHRFMTLLVDPAFDDITSALLWDREYVMGWETTDKSKAKAVAGSKNTTVFYDSVDEYGILMYRAFGQFLSQNSWKDLQLTRLDDSDSMGIKDLGEAEDLFNNKISFAITDPEYKTCLALFACGGFTITAPYVLAQARIQVQSLFVQYLSLRNPKYTIREAGLIEKYLNDNMEQIFVQSNLTEKLNINVDLDDSLNDWYVLGTMEMKRPRAIWRMRLDFYQDILQ